MLPLLALLSLLALLIERPAHCRPSMFEVLDEDLLVGLPGGEKAMDVDKSKETLMKNENRGKWFFSTRKKKQEASCS